MKKIFLILIFFTGCKEKIVSDLDQLKTNQILIALSKYGVDANKARDGNLWSIEVSTEDRDKALEILSAGRFLSEFSEELESTSFVKSKTELQHSLERKLSKSLEQTLKRMPYVLDARVHISSNEVSDFVKVLPERTAAVLIVVEPSSKVDDEKIKKLISGASGVETEKVTVVLVNSQQPTLQITKNTKDFDRYFLALIPILILSILMVRKLESAERKSKEIKKVVKLENE